METYLLESSTRRDKKYMVTTPNGKTIHFGAEGYEDYTTHHDENRMHNYLKRHQAREDWTEDGINTAGFWSRWILWNLPSLGDSIQDTADRFDINIEYLL